VAVGGNSKHDLVRGNASGHPSLDGVGRGAGLKRGTRVSQRSVRADAGGSPLSLRSELSDADVRVKHDGYPH
jgi:hypothetical protein